jgi:FkbM family methyltransferase
MKINYFDLGLHKDAAEVDMFISVCDKNGFDYTVYGFEAHPDYCADLVDKYADNEKVNIFNKAISNKNGTTELYIAEKNEGEGNSIFRTKNNVNPENFIKVDSILFSDWLRKNVPDFETENNILRFNIEGAEWYLVNDLNDNKMLKSFKIVVGSKTDIPKVKELSKNINDYEKILSQNNIIIQKFTKNKPHTNCDLGSLIKKTFV